MAESCYLENASSNASQNSCSPTSYDPYAFSDSPSKEEEEEYARIDRAIMNIMDHDGGAPTPATQVTSTNAAKPRHAPWKVEVLRRHFSENPYCSKNLRSQLSEELSMTPKEITVSPR